MAAAAALIRDLMQPQNGMVQREKIRQLVATRKPEKFIATLVSELEKIQQAPARSERMPTPRGLAECLPFGLRSRLPGKETFLK